MFNRYVVGNAQSIGCREVQSNYFSTVYNDAGSLFAVLADGTIDHPNGRQAAIMAVEFCVDSFKMSSTYTVQFLFETALKANRHIQDMIFLNKSPRLSLSMCLFTGKEILYFNVGVNTICLYNGHGERVLCDDASRSYSSGGYELLRKNTVGMFTAGAYANAQPIERIKIIASTKKALDKARTIVEAINEKGLKNQLNATALLIEVVK